jgi:hypothetical protein
MSNHLPGIANGMTNIGISVVRYPLPVLLLKWSQKANCMPPHLRSSPAPALALHPTLKTSFFRKRSPVKDGFSKGYQRDVVVDRIVPKKRSVVSLKARYRRICSYPSVDYGPARNVFSASPYHEAKQPTSFPAEHCSSLRFQSHLRFEYSPPRSLECLYCCHQIFPKWNIDQSAER